MWEKLRRQTLILELDRKKRYTALRIFACWCANRAHYDERWSQFVFAAEAHALGEISLAEMLLVRQASHYAMFNKTAWVYRPTNYVAPACWSAYQTTYADPAEAALMSARFSANSAFIRQHQDGKRGDEECLDEINLQIQWLQFMSHPKVVFRGHRSGEST